MNGDKKGKVTFDFSRKISTLFGWKIALDQSKAGLHEHGCNHNFAFHPHENIM